MTKRTEPMTGTRKPRHNAQDGRKGGGMSPWPFLLPDAPEGPQRAGKGEG